MDPPHYQSSAFIHALADSVTSSSAGTTSATTATTTINSSGSINTTIQVQPKNIIHDRTATSSSECQVWTTPLDTKTGSPRTGLVVTLLLTSHEPNYQRIMKSLLCNAIPSQYTHLYEPQGWDFLLVLEQDNDDIDNIAKLLTTCLEATFQKQQQPVVWNNLDGSTLSTMAYSTPHGRTIYVGRTTVSYPKYIQDNPNEYLLRNITPETCNAPKSYIQGTRWYTDELLHLQILQEYDYFIKLDLDIYFEKTMPLALLDDMDHRGAIFAHTAEMGNAFGGDTACSTGILEAIDLYVKHHHHHHVPLSANNNNNNNNNNNSTNYFCTTHSWPFLKANTDLYYTNFIIGRVAFWTSPQVLSFGKFLSNYPHGFFWHRWTDQIFWHYAMALFVQDFYTSGAVVDYTEFRCSPEVDCWEAVFFDKLYSEEGSPSYCQCTNGGLFLHYKDPTRKWNKTKSVTTLWRSDTEIWNTSYKADCLNAISRKRKEKNKEKR